MPILPLVTSLLLGCPPPQEPQDSDSPAADSPGEPDLSFLEGMDCEALVDDPTTDPATGDCVEAEAVTGGTALAINAVCTDAAITGLGSKRHLVVIPDDVQTDLLWLHLGGSGGRPLNSKKLGLAALSEGYRYVSLAYPNEPSIANRCTCEGLGPRPLTCEEWARFEVLTGQDASPWLEMETDEGIEYRLKALLLTLHDRQPAGGWDAYLDSEGEIVWEKVALSGFSQGGGMAGLIAREHRVDRVLYLSKGGGSSLQAMVDPSTYVACSADMPCDDGATCCPFDDLACDTPPDEGGLCAIQTPNPWVFAGPDTDGDFMGDGDASLRATPSDRQFAAIHADEGAWDYSPEVFSAWGMGDRSDYVDVGADQGPYPSTTQLFTLDLPPGGNCSEHQSMSADACLSVHPDTGLPALLPVWLHVMTQP